MKNRLHIFTMGLMLSASPLVAYPPMTDYHDLSSFELKFNGDGRIMVSVDGHYYYEPVRKFSLDNVAPGNHFLEVFVERNNYNGYYGSTQRYKLFGGNIYIQPASLVRATIDNKGRFQIKDVGPLVTYMPYEPYNPYNPYPEYDPYHAPNTCAPVPYAMSEGTFLQLLNTIDAQWFDSSKMTVAEQTLQGNNFTAAQVARMMHMFSFESSRLELAKKAYSRCMDKQNYFVVNNEFTFNSSVQELNRYISGFH
ncbi:MAG: DUF4476 domain-containing protein [Chitinophagales bacterium]